MGPAPPGLVPALLLLLLGPYLGSASVIGRDEVHRLQRSDACPAESEACPEFSSAPVAALKYLVCGATKNAPSWLSPQRLLAVQVDLSDTLQRERASALATDACKRYKVKKVFDLSPSAPPRPLAGFADLLLSKGCDTHGVFAKPGHVIIVSEKPLNVTESDVIPLGGDVFVYRLPSHVSFTVPSCFEPQRRTGRRPPENALLLADTEPDTDAPCQLRHGSISLGCPVCASFLSDELKERVCTTPSAFIVKRNAERLTEIAPLRTERQINIRVEERRPLGSNGSDSTKCVQGTFAILDDVSPGGIDTTANQVNFLMRSHCSCEFLRKDAGYAVLLHNKPVPKAGRTVLLDESFTIISLPKGVTKLSSCAGSDTDIELMLGDQPYQEGAAPPQRSAMPGSVPQSCPVCHSDLQPDLYNPICRAQTVVRMLSLNPAIRDPTGAYVGKTRLVQSVRGAQEKVQDTFVYTMADKCNCDYVAKPSRQYFVFMGHLPPSRGEMNYLPMTDQMHILAYSYRNARLLHDALSACPDAVTASDHVAQKRVDTQGIADQAAYGGGYGGASGPLYGSSDAVPAHADPRASDGYSALNTGRSASAGYGAPNYSGMPPPPSYDGGYAASHGPAPSYSLGPSPSHAVPTATAVYAPPPPSYNAASARSHGDSTADPSYAAPSPNYGATTAPAYGPVMRPPTYKSPAANYGGSAVTTGYAARSPSYSVTSAPNYGTQASVPRAAYSSATAAPSYSAAAGYGAAASYGAPSKANSANYGAKASVGYSPAASGGYGAAPSAAASGYGAQPTGYGSVPQPSYSGGSGQMHQPSSSYTPEPTYKAGSMGGTHGPAHDPAPVPSYTAAPAGGYGSSGTASYGAVQVTYAPGYAASATASSLYPAEPADYSSSNAHTSPGSSYGALGHTGFAAPGYVPAGNPGSTTYSQHANGAGSTANKGYVGSSSGYNTAPASGHSASYGARSPSYGSASAGAPSYGSAPAAIYGAPPSASSEYGPHGSGAQRYGAPSSGSYASAAAAGYGSAAPSGHNGAPAYTGSSGADAYGPPHLSGGVPTYAPASNAGHGSPGANTYGASSSGGYGGGYSPSHVAHGQDSSPTYGSAGYGATPTGAPGVNAYGSSGDVTYVPPYGIAEYPPSFYQPLYPSDDEQATVISYVPTYATEEEYYAVGQGSYEDGGGYAASGATYAPSHYAAPAYSMTYAPELQSIVVSPYPSGDGQGYGSPYGTYAPSLAGKNGKPSYAAPPSSAYSAPSYGTAAPPSYGSSPPAPIHSAPVYPPAGGSKPSFDGLAQSQPYGLGSSAAAAVSYAPPVQAASAYPQPSYGGGRAVAPYAPGSRGPNGGNYEVKPNSAGSSSGPYQPNSYGSAPPYSRGMAPSGQNPAAAYNVPVPSYAPHTTSGHGAGYPSHSYSVSAAPAYAKPQPYGQAPQMTPHGGKPNYSSAPASSVTYSPPSLPAPSYSQASSGGGSQYAHAGYKHPQHSNSAAAGYGAKYATTAGYGSAGGKDASYGMAPSYRSPSKAYDESQGRNPSYSAQPSASYSAPAYGKDPTLTQPSPQAYTTPSYDAVSYTTQSSGGPSYGATYAPAAPSGPAYSQSSSNEPTKAEASYSVPSGGAEYSAASYAPPSKVAPSYNDPSYSASSAPPTYSVPSYVASYLPPAVMNYALSPSYAASGAHSPPYAHSSMAAQGAPNGEKPYGHTVSPPIYPVATYAPPAYAAPSYVRPVYAVSYAPPAYSAPAYFGAAAPSPSYSQPSYVASHAPPAYSAPVYASVPSYGPAPQQPAYAAPLYLPAAYAPAVHVPSSYAQPAYTSPVHTAPLYPSNTQQFYSVPVYPHPSYTGPQYSRPSYNQPQYDATHAPPAYSAPSYEASYAPPAYSAPSYAQPSYSKPSNLVSYAPPAYSAPSYSQQQLYSGTSAPAAYKAPAYGESSYSQPAYKGTVAHPPGAQYVPAYSMPTSHVQYPAGYHTMPTYGTNGAKPAAYNQPSYPRSPQPVVTVSYNFPVKPLPSYYAPAGQPAYAMPASAPAVAYGPAEPSYSPTPMTAYGAPAAPYAGAHGAPPSYSAPSPYEPAAGGHGSGGGNGAYGAAGGVSSYGSSGGSAGSYGQVAYTTTSYPSATPTYGSSYTTSSGQSQYTTYGAHSPSYTTHSAPSSQAAYTTYGYSQPTYTTYAPNYSQQSYTTYGTSAVYSPETTYSPAPSYPDPDYESQAYHNAPASYGPTYAPSGHAGAPTYSPPSHGAPSYGEPGLSHPSYSAATGYTTVGYSGVTHASQGYSGPTYSPPMNAAQSYRETSYPAPTYSVAATYAPTGHPPATYASHEFSAGSYAPVVSAAPSYPSYAPPTYITPGYSTSSYPGVTYSPPAHGEATYAPPGQPAPDYPASSLSEYRSVEPSYLVQPGYGRSVLPEMSRQYALAKGLDMMYSEAYPLETSAVEIPIKPRCPQAMPTCPVCATGLHQELLNNICNYDLVAEGEISHPPQLGKEYGGMCSEMCIGDIFHGQGYSVMDKIRFSVNKYCSCETMSKSFTKVILLSYRHNWRAHGGSYGQLLLDDRTVLLPHKPSTIKAIQEALRKCYHTRRYPAVRTYADAAYAGPAGCPYPFEESCPHCASTMTAETLVADICSAEYAAVVAIGLDYQKMAEYKNGRFTWKQAYLPDIQVTNETAFGKNLSVVIKVNGAPSENASTDREPSSLTDSCMTYTVKALYNVSRGMKPVEDSYDLQLFLNKQCPCQQLKSQIPGYAILVVDKQSKLSDGSMQLGTGAKLYPLPYGMHTLPPCSVDKNSQLNGHGGESKLPLPELEIPVADSTDVADADEGPCPVNIHATCPVCMEASEEPAAAITQYCKSDYAAVVSIPDDAFSASTDSAIQPWWAPKINISVVPYGSYAQISVTVKPKARYQFPETDRTVGHADNSRRCRSGRLHVKQEVTPGPRGGAVDAVKFTVLSSCKCSFLEQPTHFALLASKQAPEGGQPLHLSEDVTLIGLPLGKTELPQCVRPVPTKKPVWKQLVFW